MSRRDLEDMIGATAARAAHECVLTNGRRVVSVMESGNCEHGYDVSWADVVGDGDVRRLRADEGILVDWDDLPDAERLAYESLNPDAYSVGVSFLYGDLALCDPCCARGAREPYAGVATLSTTAFDFSELVGEDHVAERFLTELLGTEVDVSRASSILLHIATPEFIDEHVRLTPEQTHWEGSHVVTGANDSLERQAFEAELERLWLDGGDDGRANAETKDRNHEEIGISPSFDMNDAELSAGWYHLTSFDVLDALSGSFPEAVESAHENPTLAATASTVTGDEPAHEDEQGREARDGEEI